MKRFFERPLPDRFYRIKRYFKISWMVYLCFIGCNAFALFLPPFLHVQLGVDLLYQQLCAQNFTYAKGQNIAGNTTTSRLLDVPAQFYLGFQLWAGWNLCAKNHFAFLAYKHLWSYQDCRKVSNKSFNALLIVNNALNAAEIFSAKARQQSRYDTAFIHFGSLLYANQETYFYGYTGFRYLRAEVIREIIAPTSFVIDKERDHSCFQAGGIDLGVGGIYGIGNGVYLVSQIEAIALLGSRSDSYQLISATSSLPTIEKNRFQKQTCLHCAPGMRCLVGINYVYDACVCGCCFHLVGELGWEMDYYWDVLVLRSTNFDLLNTQKTISTHFASNGPYGSLALHF